MESKFLSSSYILNISPLLDLGLVKIFFLSVVCLFVLLTMSFALQKLFNCMRSHLSILYLTAQAISVLLRNFFPMPITSRLFPTFSSISFRVSGFMWSSLIHLDLMALLSSCLMREPGNISSRTIVCALRGDTWYLVKVFGLYAVVSFRK